MAEPLTATYAEFAIEQRLEALPDSTLEYWKKTLDGMRPQGSIPHEGPDPSGDTAGERVLVLPDECTAGFRQFCQAHRMSSFMAVAALVNVSLAAMWDLTDITLTTAASTRPARYRDVLGNYTNNVLLRSAVPPSTTLFEAAAAARGTVLGALRHPAQLQKIAEAVDGSLDAPPIRIHYLASNAHYYKMLDSKPSGASWKEPAEFPGWSLEVGFAEDSRRRVAIWMQYDPRRFQHDRIQELVYCCRTLLEACATGDQSVNVAWLKDRLRDREPLPD
jgi:Condensation domain